MAMDAPRFKNNGRVREFIDDDGKSYLVICFPDGSAGVYQRKKGTGKGVADYEPVPDGTQIRIMKKLGATGAKGETTYELANELCSN